MSAKKLLELQDKIKQAETQLAINQGKSEQIKSDLKAKGLMTPKDVRAKISELDTEIAKLGGAFRALIEELEILWEEGA